MTGLDLSLKYWIGHVTIRPTSPSMLLHFWNYSFKQNLVCEFGIAE